MHLAIELLTPRPLTSKDDARLVWELWRNGLPDYLPEYIGNWEPIDSRLDPQDADALVSMWRWPLLAIKRSSPIIEASVFMRKAGTFQHAVWSLHLMCDATVIDRVVEFVKVAAIQLQVDFGCVTVLSDSEQRSGSDAGAVIYLDRKRTKAHLSITTQLLQQYLPNLYWITILGAPYVKLFGREKLNKAPVYTTEWLSSQCVCMQMTEDILDVANERAPYYHAVVAAREHLGRRAFFVERGYPNYLAAKFEFES